MSKYTPIYLLLLVTLITSCGEPLHPELSQKADSLLVELNDPEFPINKIDTSGFGDMVNKITENMLYLQENYKDTMNRETAILVSDYSRLRKLIRKQHDKYRETAFEWERTRNQLEDLKRDINNDKVKESEIEDLKLREPNLSSTEYHHFLLKGYLEAESTAAERVKQSSEKLVEVYAKMKRRYNKWSPDVESIVDSLKQSNS